MTRFQLLTIILIPVFLWSCRKDDSASCTALHSTFTSENKVGGVSFDASIFSTTDTIFNSVIDVNANWVSLIPFAYLNDNDYDFFWDEGGWWGMSKEGMEALANFAHARGLKVLMKPQVSVNAGFIFTGNYSRNSEADWQTFENDYRAYIMDFAYLAESVNAEAFCIGNEWKTFINERPQFWTSLIAEVRSVYSGLITYAANWDEYTEVHFWEQLDFIGVNAYFPITDSHTPTVADMVSGWQKYIAELSMFCCRLQKQMVFTEYGYRSVDYTALEPWNTEEYFGDTKLNLEAQKNAYEGFFQALWQEDWFGGGFLWKWWGYHHTSGGENDNRFTPQNKPAESVIRTYYGM